MSPRRLGSEKRTRKRDGGPRPDPCDHRREREATEARQRHERVGGRSHFARIRGTVVWRVQSGAQCSGPFTRLGADQPIRRRSGDLLAGGRHGPSPLRKGRGTETPRPLPSRCSSCLGIRDMGPCAVLAAEDTMPSALDRRLLPARQPCVRLSLSESTTRCLSLAF